MSTVKVDLSTMNAVSEQFLQQFMEEFKRRVEEKTPVQTGALRDGWRLTQQGQSEAVLTNTEDYAAAVEYGTVKMEPRAMVRRTIEEREDIAREVLQGVSK